jgi:hypothetical protein
MGGRYHFSLPIDSTDHFHQLMCDKNNFLLVLNINKNIGHNIWSPMYDIDRYLLPMENGDHP